MFSLANPEYLYLLLLAPAIAVLHFFARASRAKRLRKYGNPETVKGLMPEFSPYKPAIRLGIEIALIVVISIMLARPRYGSNVTTGKVRGLEVAIAVDVSNSMDAAATSEGGVSRLQQAKLVLEKLIDKLNGDKVSLIVFAGRAYMQMPMTADAQSSKMFLNGINTRMAPTQGTAIGAAIEMATQSFSHDGNTSKTIIIITDGENFDDDAAGAAKRAAKDGIQVNVMGVGSDTGARIPLEGGGYFTDDNGNEVVTRLDEESAKQIAKAGKGVYVQGTAADAVDAMEDVMDKLAKGNSSVVQYTRHNEQFTVFAWLALALILVDVFLMDKTNTWLNKHDFFTRRKENAENEK